MFRRIESLQADIDQLIADREAIRALLRPNWTYILCTAVTLTVVAVVAYVVLTPSTPALIWIREKRTWQTMTTHQDKVGETCIGSGDTRICTPFYGTRTETQTHYSITTDEGAINVSQHVYDSLRLGLRYLVEMKLGTIVRVVRLAEPSERLPTPTPAETAW